MDNLNIGEVAAIIDADEFEEARHDPCVQAFLKEADAYLEALDREGRNL